MNNCSEDDYEEAIHEAITEWQERSEHKWTLDVSLVDGWDGIKIRL